MDFTLRWNGDAEDLVIELAATASAACVDDIVQAMLSDPQHVPGLRLLLDLRALDWSRASGTAIRRQVKVCAKQAERLKPSSVAVVMRRPLDFGVMRAVQALDELPFPLAVFASVKGARQWLRNAGIKRPESAVTTT